MNKNTVQEIHLMLKNWQQHPPAVRIIIYGIFIAFSFYTVVTVAILGFGLDSEIPYDENLPIFVLSWLLSPIVSLAVIGGMFWYKSDIQEVTPFHRALLGWNVFSVLFLSLLLKLLGGITGVAVVILPPLFIILLVNLALAIQRTQRISIKLIIGGILVNLVAFWGVSQPISINVQNDDFRLTLSAPNRFMAPCQTIYWNGDGSKEMALTRVLEDNFSGADGTLLGVAAQGSYELCIDHPQAHQIYGIRANMLDGSVDLYSLTLNAITLRGKIILGLSALGILFGPLLITHYSLWIFVVIASVGAILPFLGLYWSFDFRLAAISLILSISLFLYKPLQTLLARRGVWQITDGIMFILIPILMINAFLPYDYYHINFWLGPINDVMQGKVLLVETVSQYGILSQYIIAALFKLLPIPLYYESFALFNYVLLAFVTLLMYVTLRKITSSPLPGILFVISASVLYVGFSFYTVSTHPSLGMLRYGFQYLLIFLLTMRLHYDQYRRWILMLEFIVLALAFGWSFETWIFTWLMYLILLITINLLTSKDWEEGTLATFKSLAIMLSSAFIIVIGFTLYTFIRSGQLPEWSIYFSYVAIYSDFGSRFFVYRPWLPFIGAMYGTLTVFLFKLLYTNNRQSLLIYVPVVGMAILGISQMAYWIRVPNIHSLPIFGMPVLFIGAFWLDQIRLEKIPQTIKYLARVTIIFGFWMLILGELNARPTAVESPTPLTLLFGDNRSTNLDDVMQYGHPHIRFQLPNHYDVHFVALVDLVNEYGADVEQIGLFAPPDTSTAVLLATHKTHLYRLANPYMDNYTDATAEWSLADPYTPKIGDLFFIAEGTEVFWVPVQQIHWERTQEQVSFEKIAEKDNNTVWRVIAVEDS